VATAEARQYGKVFDEVAAEYDRSRPGYPRELIEEACALAGLERGDRVLEVGCGSGQLTRDLLTAGLEVVAVEPGAQLLSLAAGNLEGVGEVSFVNARFEDAQLPSGHSRAMFAAASFHWIDPEVSWAKVADVLAPGGTLALMQHCGLEEQRSLDDQQALLSMLARVAPEIAAGWPAYRDLPSLLDGVEQRSENVSEVWAWVGSHDLARPEAGRLFEDVQVAAVPSLVEQTAEELNALFGTISAYSRLSPGQRQEIESEFLALQERLGRPIRSSTVCVLVTARVAGRDTAV
jgi:ubiquinone/menaquinone biosynthesis C-methylase UbiE